MTVPDGPPAAPGTLTARGGGTGAGRPNQGRTRRSLWLDDDTWDAADDAADELGVSQSEVVRRAIRAGLPTVTGG